MSGLSGADEDPAPSCTSQSLSAEQDKAEVQGQDAASTSGRSESEAIKTPCAFYMRTGTCAYGERCKFLHPEDRPTVYSNSRGLPLRPEEPECSFYVRNGWCAFADTCKFHHPELPAGGPTPPVSGQHSPSFSTQQQQHQQQQYGSRPHRNGTTRQHAGSHHHRGGSGSSQHQQQHHQQQHLPQHSYHAAPYAYYMAPYHGPMGGGSGQGLVMHYGYYPAMHAGSGRMYPVVTSAMIHPVMHLRPYGSGPVAANAPAQRSGLQRSSSSGSAHKGGPGSDRAVSSGSRPGRYLVNERAPMGWPGMGGSYGNGPTSRGPRGGPGGDSGNRRNKSPVGSGNRGSFGPMGPSPEAKAAAAAAVAAATAAPMPRPSSASPSKQRRESATGAAEAGEQQGDK